MEVAIGGTGEQAVQAVRAETGSASARIVSVGTLKRDHPFTVSKGVIGSDIPNYRFIVVIGSQDGFGTGKWRDVMEEPATWTLGGGANPAPDDGIDYDPNIIDVVLEGEGQEAMLSSYDVNGHVYAQLTGFEMPEVSQQIFGASVDTVTSSSAVLTWSTTVADATSVRVAPAGQEPGANDVVSWTSAGTDHAITLTELTVNTSYWAYIGANETTDVVLWFNTSNVVDETPPDVLNLAVEVLEDGRVIVSWYTSERATESVLINGESVHEDAFATKKNHQITTAVLSDGTYELEVVSADASGNLNSSTLAFTVTVGATVVDEPSSTDDDEDEVAVSEVSSSTIQLVALVVVVLVLLAFLRVRRHDVDDENDPWK